MWCGPKEEQRVRRALHAEYSHAQITVTNNFGPDVMLCTLVYFHAQAVGYVRATHVVEDAWANWH